MTEAAGNRLFLAAATAENVTAQGLDERDGEEGHRPAHGEVHRRRNSPNGVESFSDMGTSYVSRYDSDLDRQLRINAWTPPRVG